MASKMAGGIGEVGTSVPITVITQSLMLTNRAAFNTAENLFNAGRLALSNAYKASQEAETGLYDWLGAAKAVFAASFGLTWSTEWASTGFINNSIAIPRQIGDRIGLAQNIVQFLTANPSYEVPSLNVSADFGGDIYAAAVSGQKAVTDAEQARDALELNRQAARTTVVDGMRGLVEESRGKLGPMDARWLAFGLQKPGARVTPAKPTGLNVTLIGSDALQVTCDAMPLATRYRFRMRQMGPGNVFRLIASTVDPLAMIQPVPAGATVEIMAQAVNDNLQSVASDPVAMVIPAVEVSATAPAVTGPATVELASLAANQPNGNGKAKRTGATGTARGMAAALS